MKKIGVVINPIAGMGGSVGLKGTDGFEILEEAVKRGAIRHSEERTIDALKILKTSSTVIFSCEGNMGGDILTRLGIGYNSVKEAADITTERDTIETVERFLKEKVDLIVFAGGDGTARNVCEVVADKIPVIGVPTGVKIHSPVFCITPFAAADLLKQFTKGKINQFKEAEVIDLNEEDYRKEKINTKLFGYMKIPYDSKLVQCKKTGSSSNEKRSQIAIAEFVIEDMKKDEIYLIGAGSTTKAITDRLNIKGSLLGIDAVKNKKIIGKDLQENEIINLIDNEIVNLVITPIGGQGFIFGRGNQQLSGKILNQINKKKILIVSAKEKLNSLMGKNLLIDTGNEVINKYLRGYYKVLTGYHEFTFYPASDKL